MSERLVIGEAITAGIRASDNALDQPQEIIDNLAKAGFVIVPRDPTTAMLKASRHSTASSKTIEACDRAIYEAMIAAALAS